MGSRPDVRSVPAALIVDDDSTMRLLMRESLEQAGFRVVEAADGAAGLLRAAEAPPDIIFLDVDMPALDGFEVCRRLRDDPATVGIPIIMVTGKDDTDSIRHAFDSGATDFIAKPINWTMLGYRSHYVLRGARTMRALQHSEKKFAAIVGALPDVQIHVGRDLSLLDFAAPADFAPFLDQPHAVGRSIADLLPEPAAGRLVATIDRAFATPAPQTIEFSLPTADGPCNYEARLFRIGEDEVLGLIRDITERERTVARMKEALIVFDSSLEGIFTTDPSGRILSVNAAYCAMSGYAAAELIGQRSSLFRSDWHPAEFYASLWKRQALLFRS